MTGLEYVNSILKKYAIDPNKHAQYRTLLLPYITYWANGFLIDVKISGSSKKGTAVSSGTDVDLFISLASTTPNNLNEIYESLFYYMQGRNFIVKRQNVSIGIDYNGDQIDLVPARRQNQFGNDHSLFVSKVNTWTKTNIDTHISQITNSKRQSEIKLGKIWRDINGLDFPSFYLELVFIDALKGSLNGATDVNFLKVLKFIGNSLETKTYMDPANTNNCISDQIKPAVKKEIAQLALKSASQKYWRDIVA